MFVTPSFIRMNQGISSTFLNATTEITLDQGLVAVVLAVGIVLRRFRQPHVVAYIVAGVLLGPSAIGIVHDADVMSRLGSIGVVLLLFFVGMEIDLHGLLA
ncbi:MAG: cation:proton antiporter, partial [Phycisphaerae bacterium]